MKYGGFPGVIGADNHYGLRQRERNFFQLFEIIYGYFGYHFISLFYVQNTILTCAKNINLRLHFCGVKKKVQGISQEKEVSFAARRKEYNYSLTNYFKRRDGDLDNKKATGFHKNGRR